MINQMAKRRSTQPANNKRASDNAREVLKLVLPKKPGNKPSKSVKQLLHELRHGS